MTWLRMSFLWKGTKTIVGGSGPSTIWGTGGADTLIGGGGNTTLWGGTGNDSLIGGTGDNEFHYRFTTGTSGDNGVHTVTLTLKTAANQTVTVNDTTATALRALVTVAPNTPFDVTVTALNPYGNVDVNYRGTVSLSTTDPDSGVVLPGDYTFGDGDNGIHTFAGAISLVTHGDQVLTVTDGDNGFSAAATITVIDSGSPSVPGAGGRVRPGASPVTVARQDPAAPMAVQATPAGPAGWIVAADAGECSHTADARSPQGILHVRHVLDYFFAEGLDADWDGLLGVRLGWN